MGCFSLLEPRGGKAIIIQKLFRDVHVDDGIQGGNSYSGAASSCWNNGASARSMAYH